MYGAARCHPNLFHPTMRRLAATCAAFCAPSAPPPPASCLPLPTRLSMIVHRTRQQRQRTRAFALGLLLTVVAPALVAAQQPDEPPPPRRALTLDEAINLAARTSDQLRIARAGVSRAGGQLRQARSGYLPQ